MGSSKSIFLIALVTGMALCVGAALGFHAKPAAAQQKFSSAPASQIYLVPDASVALANVSFDNNPQAIRDFSLNPAD